jgi:hypothetical protein
MTKMTAVKVLRSTRVAEGGNIHGREIVAGTDDVVPAELFKDLKAEGYIAAAVQKAAAPVTPPAVRPASPPASPPAEPAVTLTAAPKA